MIGVFLIFGVALFHILFYPLHPSLPNGFAIYKVQNAFVASLFGGTTLEWKMSTKPRSSYRTLRE